MSAQREKQKDGPQHLFLNCAGMLHRHSYQALSAGIIGMQCPQALSAVPRMRQVFQTCRQEGVRVKGVEAYQCSVDSYFLRSCYQIG